ncbi:diguanylate cyclase [Eubacteriaceae bacterium ES2]|nr:diguanylate cyclase [Eubacteriaceae bacterium ES2]
MKSLKQKFRLIMMGIAAVAMIIAGVLFFGEVLKVTDQIVKSYARLYNNEIVAEIDNYINREIGLVQKLSNTSDIEDFLKEPLDQGIEDIALLSINEFNQVFLNNNTFLVPAATQDFYFLDQDSSEIVPEGRLESANEQDAWYFDLLSSDDEYRLKIDKDRFLGTIGLWINMKVYDQGRLIGVVGTQLSMESLIDEILIDYEESGVKTLVINENGEIELGKFEENNVDEGLVDGEPPENKENQDNGHPAELISTYLTDFDFTAIQACFEATGQDDSYVFEINNNGYEVGAVAPILDSGWYVISLYDTHNFLSSNDIFYYILLLLGIMAGLALAINILIEKMLISPFSKIMASTVLKEGQREAEIYGLNRNDEFGELARSIDKMSRQLVESIPVGLFIVDQQQEFQYGNPYFLKMFKCPSSEVFRQTLGESPEKIFGSRGVYQAFLDRMIKKSTYLTVEMELGDLQGGSFWAEVQIAKTWKNQFEYEFEGIVINVTEKKKEENRLIEEASRDALTGLYNRAYFNRAFEKEIEHGDRYRSDLSLVIFDLDNFKQINDTYGHQIGDDVLKQTAKIAGDLLRQSDILVRWGGEEFVILMPDTSLASAVAVSERIRKALKAYSHPEAGPVTASFGVTIRCRHEELLPFFTRVDQALYEAKESGRDRVCAEDCEYLEQ